MAVYVLEMSTDADIVATNLDARWGSIVDRWRFAQVCGGGLEIPDDATIVVIAHGNGSVIGNSVGFPAIIAKDFVVGININMASGATPAAIYISTCGTGIAEYAAHVALAAESMGIWTGIALCGHSDPVAGNVPPPPPPHSLGGAWTQIFVNQGRRS